MLARRSFLAGLGAALFSAPAIVKAASIMPVKSIVIPQASVDAVLTMDEYADRVLAPRINELAEQEAAAILSPNMLTMQQITREAVRGFANSNAFLKQLDEQYKKDFEYSSDPQWGDLFKQPVRKIGTTLRIRLPQDFKVRQTHDFTT